MKKKARTLLQQVLLEHLEQEISQVPEEQEIRKQHSFSDKFVEDMEKLTSEQDRVIRMEKKNKQKTRRRLFLQAAAACLSIVILFGAGAAALSTIRMGSSKGTDQSYDFSITDFKGDSLDGFNHAISDIKILDFKHGYSSLFSNIRLDDFLVGLNLSRKSLSKQLPEVEYCNSFANTHDQLHIMFNQQN